MIKASAEVCRLSTYFAYLAYSCPVIDIMETILKYSIVYTVYHYIQLDAV
jgi:hypothetical protein